MKKISFLFALLCASVMAFASSITVAHNSTTTVNMSGANQANLFSDGNGALSTSVWSFIGSKNDASNNVGLNKDGTTRLYCSNAASGDNGSSLAVTLTGGTINSISVSVKSGTTLAVLVGGSAITQSDDLYNINASSFTIQNKAAKGASQVQLNSITINYKMDDEIDIDATDIDLNLSQVTMEQYREETLTASLTPANATTVVAWSSSDPTLASVSNGVITALAASGSVTITATAGDVSAECAVTLQPATVLTCEQAAEKAASVGANNENYPGGRYVVEGYAISTRADQWIWIADDKDAAQGTFEIYLPSNKSEIANVEIGDKIRGIGYITKYNTSYEFASGCTFEILQETPTFGIIFIGNDPEQGIVTADKTEYEENEPVELTIAPANGYQFDGLTIQNSAGATIASAGPDDITNNTYTTYMANGGLTILVAWSLIPIEHAITVITDGFGEATVTDFSMQEVTSALPNTPLLLNFNPNPNYHLYALYMNDEEQVIDASATQWEFIMPEVDVTFSVYFEQENLYTITVTQPTDGGTIEADKAEAAEGEIVTLTAIPAEGYRLVEWDVEGEDFMPISVYNYGQFDQFEMPAQNVNVTATFEAIQVTPVTLQMTPTYGFLSWVEDEGQWGVTMYEYAANHGENDDPLNLMFSHIGGTSEEVLPTSVDISGLGAGEGAFACLIPGEEFDAEAVNITLNFTFSDAGIIKEERTEAGGNKYLYVYVMGKVSGEMTDAAGNKMVINEPAEDIEFFIKSEPLNPTTLDQLLNSSKAVKIIENGQVVILRDGKRFNILGTEMR